MLLEPGQWGGPDAQHLGVSTVLSLVAALAVSQPEWGPATPCPGSALGSGLLLVVVIVAASSAPRPARSSGPFGGPPAGAGAVRPDPDAGLATHHDQHAPLSGV